MGNHESPCIVCGDNTMSAFTYDCEQRHTIKAVSIALEDLRKRCHARHAQPCKIDARSISRLEVLLEKTR